MQSHFSNTGNASSDFQTNFLNIDGTIAPFAGRADSEASEGFSRWLAISTGLCLTTAAALAFMRHPQTCAFMFPHPAAPSTRFFSDLSQLLSPHSLVRPTWPHLTVVSPTSSTSSHAMSSGGAPVHALHQSPSVPRPPRLSLVPLSSTSPLDEAPDMLSSRALTPRDLTLNRPHTVGPFQIMQTENGLRLIVTDPAITPEHCAWRDIDINHLRDSTSINVLSPTLVPSSSRKSSQLVLKGYANGQLNSHETYTYAEGGTSFSVVDHLKSKEAHETSPITRQGGVIQTVEGKLVASYVISKNPSHTRVTIPYLGMHVTQDAVKLPPMLQHLGMVPNTHHGRGVQIAGTLMHKDYLLLKSETSDGHPLCMSITPHAINVSRWGVGTQTDLLLRQGEPSSVFYQVRHDWRGDATPFFPKLTLTKKQIDPKIPNTPEGIPASPNHDWILETSAGKQVRITGSAGITVGGPLSSAIDAPAIAFAENTPVSIYLAEDLTTPGALPVKWNPTTGTLTLPDGTVGTGSNLTLSLSHQARVITDNTGTATPDCSHFLSATLPHPDTQDLLRITPTQVKALSFTLTQHNSAQTHLDISDIHMRVIASPQALDIYTQAPDKNKNPAWQIVRKQEGYVLMPSRPKTWIARQSHLLTGMRIFDATTGKWLNHKARVQPYKQPVNLLRPSPWVEGHTYIIVAPTMSGLSLTRHTYGLTNPSSTTRFIYTPETGLRLDTAIPRSLEDYRDIAPFFSGNGTSTQSS